MWLRGVNRYVLGILCVICHRLAADTIDNGLLGDPVVECGSESLTVNFKTEKAFEGHSYVKGHYTSAECRTDATLDNSVNLTVPYNDCDVLRQRSGNPRGIMITTTIIVSFHPMFITKVDKSYKVQCFYSEVAKTVTQQLDVKVGKNMEKNVLVVVGDEQIGGGGGQKNNTAGAQHDPAQEEDIHISVPLPECRYQVLTETKDGEPVKFATVGQTVYHQWTCEPESGQNESSPFCATVHSCNVREEGGKEVQLLDENGCAVDRFLLNNLEYTSDLTGGQTSQVFKFADQPSLFFQCQIRLSLKEDGACRRSSDQCPAALRGKRSTSTSENDVDVISQRMTVFDIDDPINSKTAKNFGDESAAQMPSTSDICISPIAAGALVALFGTIFVISLIAVGLLCFRPQTVKFNIVN